MRDTINRIDQTQHRDGSAGFVVGAVFCAAVIAALFTLHGGPDLFAGKFPTLDAVSSTSP